jgi:ABC-2 type transport system ATP-binding protein
VKVLGFDPASDTMAVKERIGVSLQSTRLPEKMKVHEAVELFAALYSKAVDTDSLIRRLQLWDKRAAFYSTLSGGQKQRLAIALALVNDPQVVFLDEPSTGLDPQVRLEIHSLIEEMRDQKRTILLTTHYIEEAERLCHRVAIVDEGQVIAIGSPRELQQRVLGHARVEITTVEPLDGTPPEPYAPAFSADRRHMIVSVEKPARAVVDLVKWLDSQGAELDDIHIKRPTLEDVFLELTGKKLRD